MADYTKIEWTATYPKEPVMWRGEEVDVIPGATFNIVIGCEKVSPACKNCYAEALDKRWSGGVHWGPGSDRKQMSEKYWLEPIKWDNEARKAGIKRKVFCSSLADWAEDHPQLAVPRKLLFNLIEQTPNLIWLLLTKRPENILRFIPETWIRMPMDNVWYGTTVESSDYMSRIDELCKVPAKLRFISCEPLLSDLPDLENHLSNVRLWSDRMALNGRGRIHWVIVGGESGHHARPAHPDWYREIRAACENTGVPFFFKQWGEWTEHRLSAAKKLISVFHKGFGQDMCWVGKKEAGRMLDGQFYNQMPDLRYSF